MQMSRIKCGSSDILQTLKKLQWCKEYYTGEEIENIFFQDWNKKHYVRINYKGKKRLVVVLNNDQTLTGKVLLLYTQIHTNTGHCILSFSGVTMFGDNSHQILWPYLKTYRLTVLNKPLPELVTQWKYYGFIFLDRSLNHQVIEFGVTPVQVP